MEKIEASKQTLKGEIKSIKSYIIISDKNNIFYLTIQNQFSIINMTSYYYQDNIIKYNYEKEFKLEELKENKYLCLCDNINEIYDELINLLDKNKSKIIEGNNKIDLNIPIDNLKIKEIKFSINEKNKFSIISKLKKKMKNLKEDNRNLREEINYLKEEINKLKEDNNNKKNNNIKEEISNLKEDLKEEMDNIKEEINNIKKNNNNLKEDNKLINNRIRILDEYKLNEKIEINLYEIY